MANDPVRIAASAHMANKNGSPRDAFKARSTFALADALVGLAAADQQAKNYTEAIQIYESLDKNAAPLIKANLSILFAMGTRTRAQTKTRR